MELITDQENKASVGKRGEMIFGSCVTRFVEGHGIIFDPTFMGDKFPDIDFFVKLNGYQTKKAYFLATVKITTIGFYDVGCTKLSIVISAEKIRELKKFQVPVYVFGINNSTEEVFVLNANVLDGHANLNGVSTKYPLNEISLMKLWREVQTYYHNSKEIMNFTSIFK